MGKVTIDEDILDDIGTAIIAKGGASGPVNPTEMSEAIMSISGGSAESLSRSDVNFYRPDGLLLFSYKTSDVLATGWSLPEQPDWTIEYDTRIGKASIPMTKQGWNYTLAQVLQNVTDMGKCDIGGMYIPTDGKTHIKLVIADNYRLTQPLHFKESVNGGVVINWGDGSGDVTCSGTTATTYTHTYSQAGTYDVTLKVNSGTLTLGESSRYSIVGSTTDSTSSPFRVYSSRIQTVIFGTGVQSVTQYIFYYCCTLSCVTLPYGVTSIGEYAFSECNLLPFVEIPSSVTSMGTFTFFDCYSLYSVIIPPSITIMPNNGFYYCYSLTEITIPVNITTLGSNTFSDCYALRSVTIPSSITGIGYHVFYKCNSLTSINISSSITSFGNYAFYQCYSLQSIVIPSGVTTLGTYVFYSCRSLSSITIPSGVTEIQNYGFYYCYGIIKYDFTSATSVPTLSNANAFTGIATDAKIVVPDALYDTWITATNWSSTNIKSHIVKASAYVG